MGGEHDLAVVPFEIETAQMRDLILNRYLGRDTTLATLLDRHQVVFSHSLNARGRSIASGVLTY